MLSRLAVLMLLALTLAKDAIALRPLQQQHIHQKQSSRRDVLVFSLFALGSPFFPGISTTAAAAAADLPPFQTAKSSGLQWTDARVGSGNPLKKGATATIDYVLSTTGARYGSKIFGTTDKDMPYRWILGDGSTIAGIEQAILGSDEEGVPPMLPGGIRRVIIPQSLGYTALAENPSSACVQDGKPGPIPPPNNGAFEEYQRFKNIYCNPSRQYQPDIVMDIKLYGAQSR